MVIEKREDIAKSNYCYVETSKLAEYYVHVTYEYIIEQINEQCPPHISEFLRKDIKFQEDREPQDIEFAKFRINGSIERALEFAGTDLRTLLQDCKLESTEDFDNLKVSNMDSTEVNITVQQPRPLK